MGNWTERRDSWRMERGHGWREEEEGPRHWRDAERWPERDAASHLGLGAEYQYPAGRDPAFDWGRIEDRERSGSRGFDRPRYPKGYRRPDASILDEVCMMLGHDPDLDASEIEVDVQNAEVTLRGTVESRDEKRWAERLAEGARGVVDVHNQLRARQSLLDRAVEKVKEALSPDRHRA